MNVLITGASGWIGSAATTELLSAGHTVTGLARSDDAAAAVAALGADVVRGSLADLDVLAEAADASDAVVHLAFRHDLAFSGDFEGAVAADRAAIDALGDALEGTDRPLLIASGTLGLTLGRVGTERDVPQLTAHPRMASAAAALALVDRGVRAGVIRFSPTVHGRGDAHGFISTLVQVARELGFSGYLGDGANRWPAVHRTDAGSLVALAVEKAPAGAVLHATAEDGVPTRSIAEAIGRRLDLPVRSVDDATQFRHLAGFFGLDAPASSVLTRELLGWEPTGPTLLEDIEQGAYTDAWAVTRR